MTVTKRSVSGVIGVAFVILLFSLFGAGCRDQGGGGDGGSGTGTGTGTGSDGDGGTHSGTGTGDDGGTGTGTETGTDTETDDPAACDDAHFFVALDGADGSPGTLQQPFATLTRARDAVRDLKGASGLPDGGVMVCLRAGVYEMDEPFALASEDSGEDGKPIIYRNYPNEEVRITGSRALDPAAFEPVTDSSPVWGRLDPAAQGNVLQIDLAAEGVTDYGTLTPRGFYAGGTAALELFFDGAPMELARWPDRSANDPPQDPGDAEVEIFGDPTPDVTGTYERIGEQDGVGSFRRQGLVAGSQYNLYRYTWDYQGNTYTAWFITTNESGYPADTDPWWSLYSSDLGTFSPGTGAAGTPTANDPDRVNHGFVSIDNALSDTAFTYRGSRPERWGQADEIWLHGYWMYMWADLHARVQSIDTGSRTITLDEVPGYGIETGQPYYAENLLEEITEPGEWYVDRGTGMLYFWPPSDISGADVYVSMLEEPVVHLNEASYVTFERITFEAGRDELVRIEGGSHNELRRCVLRNAGTDGAVVSGTENGLERCQIQETGDRGVHLGGGDRPSLTEAGNYVQNCQIHDFGRWAWTYTPAVDLDGVGHRVRHNLIHDAPHSAILYGGNEHLIELNEIHDVCQFASDAGAVYAGRDWGARGNVIRYNFIHDIDTWFEGYGVHGVYLDDCLSGIHVFGNVLYRISGHAIQHGGGRDDIMENNVIARCGDGLSADSRGFEWFPERGPNNIPGDSWNLLEKLNNVGYQDEPWASRYPECAAIPNDWNAIIEPGAGWLFPEGSVFARNIGFANDDWIRATDGTLDVYAEYGDNIEDEDPLFVDEANLDLSLQPDSPAYAIPGFEEIPFDDIGIQP